MDVNELFEGFDIVVSPGDLTFDPSSHRHGGIWAMFGVLRDGEDGSEKKYVCLNVGKSEDIGAELRVDLKRLKDNKCGDCKEGKEYRNQFNEKQCYYPGGAKSAEKLAYVYGNISKRYKGITVILVADIDSGLLEKYFAYTFHARYWSNGRPYYRREKPLTSEEIEDIIEDIRNKMNTPGFSNMNIKEKIDRLREQYNKYLTPAQ